MEDTSEYQPNSISASNKSTGRLTSGTYSCTNTQNSSSNYSGAKTLIVYENDESVEIKEEIFDDQGGRQDGEHNLFSENNKLDEDSISSGKKSAAQAMNAYEYDETVEIKEEIIPDQETTSGHKIDKKYESTLDTVVTREADVLSTNKLKTQKKKMIQISKTKSKKKFKCQECARSYENKCSLNIHQKFECGVVPQFICKFCDKRFKLKSNMSRHVGLLHQKTDSNEKKQEIGESKRPEVEKNHNKYRLPKINLNISQASYNCHKCSQSYSWLSDLRRHERLKHAAIKPQFICDVCGYKANQKSNLLQHISARHFKNTKISQTRNNCDKCSRSYIWLSGLRRHERLKHA